MKKLIKFTGLLAILITFIIVFFVAYFKIKAPEASTILQHYCFGNGEDLELKSDYLPNSPVIIKNLNKMRIGQNKKITLYQHEDWRLSYALNPFKLVKKQNGFEIYQYIKFDKTGTVPTKIKISFIEFYVKDSWVHILKPIPFMLHYKYIKNN